MNVQTEKLLRFTLWLIIVMVFLFILVYAQSFFVPVAIAAFLAVLVLPICQKLESWKFPRWLAITICVLLILLIIGGVSWLLSMQVISFASDIDQLKKNVTERFNAMQQMIADNFGVSAAKQAEYLRSKAGSWLQAAAGQLQKLVLGMTNALGNMLLIMIYIILFLQYRDKFSDYLLYLISNNNEEKTKDIVHQIGGVSQYYLFGKVVVIFVLALLYGFGLMIVGLKHAWLFAFIAAPMSLVPYIGNIVGGMLPVLMALLTADWKTALGVVVVLSVAQLLESYVLTPLVVGSTVDLNPLVTIMAVIVGGLFWGIAGMVLAIPALAVLKIILEGMGMNTPFSFQE